MPKNNNNKPSTASNSADKKLFKKLNPDDPKNYFNLILGNDEEAHRALGMHDKLDATSKVERPLSHIYFENQLKSQGFIKGNFN
ncbi:MAG: hypothetical protein ACK4PR_08690, partial [Gammaproteobacteria bacterium]